jgi:hypothetical protein
MSDFDVHEFWTWDWAITPAALAVNEAPPKTIEDQKWLLVMSGVVSGEQDLTLDGGDWAVLKGTGSHWFRQTVTIRPGDKTDSGFFSMDNGTHTEGPLYEVVNNPIYKFPLPFYRDGAKPGFLVDKAVSFVGMPQIYDAHESVDAGYAAIDWATNLTTRTSAEVGAALLNNVFYGIDVVVAVRDSDAWIMKLGFNITLLGKIAWVQAHGQ